MELMDIILHRRSVRAYTDDNISEEKLTKILQAGLMAPTSMNRKPCEFIVVKEKETLEKLSKSKKAAAGMLAECNAAIVVIGNTQKADTWIEDSSIALSYMSLMAADLGIGSCWCQIHLRAASTGRAAEEAVREILSISEEYGIVGILSLGVPLEQPKPHLPEEADFTKVHYWGRK